jgi:tRNA threonylcarbamoyladenosine modification (KEOPS) complex Cgi121 subunit
LKIHARAYWFDENSDPDGLKERIRKRHPGFLVQTARAEPGVNGRFIKMIAAQTLNASDTGNLLAKRPEIDFLLRLAGTTQISRAIGKSGSRKGEGFVLVVANAKKPVPQLKVGDAKQVPDRGLTGRELEKVEDAALLNAARG